MTVSNTEFFSGWGCIEAEAESQYIGLVVVLIILGIHYIDQADLTLREICLPLPLIC